MYSLNASATCSVLTKGECPVAFPANTCKGGADAQVWRKAGAETRGLSYIWRT